MASDDPTGKPARFGFGPRAIGALIPTVTRPAFRSHAAPAAQLMADWPGIVGPALAAVSFPRALSRGTLTLACSGPIALELQHLTGPLAERINAHFGRTLVQQFRFVQTIGPAVTRPAAVARARPPSPVEIPDMAPGGLRDALAALGGAVADARGRARHRA